MRNFGQLALALGLVVLFAGAAAAHGPCPGPHYGPPPAYYGVRYYPAPVYVAPAPVVVAAPVYAAPPMVQYYQPVPPPPAASFHYHNQHWGLSLGF